jgi:hypothetical protein
MSTDAILQPSNRAERLTPIPSDRLPLCYPGDTLLAAWESQAYAVQWFAAPPFNGIECTRLAISRYPLSDGGFLWEDHPFSWEELMRIKTELGFGGVYGVEVYPSIADTVNASNHRHLWLFAQPLSIGWSLYKAAP